MQISPLDAMQMYINWSKRRDNSNLSPEAVAKAFSQHAPEASKHLYIAKTSKADRDFIRTTTGTN
jgi:hypothetical protein